MRKSRAWIALCAVVVASLSVLFLARSTPPDPVVNGRALSDWLESPDYDENRDQASQAVLAAGKKGLPLLKNWLRFGSKLERRIIRNSSARLWNRWPIKQWRKQFTLKERAMSALETLGENGRDATGDLLAIVQDQTENSDTRIHAMQTLVAIRADMHAVVPVLASLPSDPAIGRSASRCLNDFQTGKFWADRPVQNIGFREREKGIITTRPPNENFTLVPGNNYPALEDLRVKAEAGNTEAQLRLSTCLHEGNPGFPKQDAEAYKWAAIAAFHENTTAKHLLRELELFLDPKDITAGKAAANAFVSGSNATPR